MTTTTRRRMRSTSVALGVTALMAAGLTGCSSSADYAAVCVNPETEERVDDDQCDDDSDYNGVGTGFFWYYLGASSRVPSVGAPVSGGTWNGSSLSGKVQRGGLPSTGGSTVKSTTKTGGFGGSSRGFSG
ncbi:MULTISPECIES: hypothetical protein [unclassified Nocardioides]|uniref:hypothetical protein n=1 Tax=unclassified Nocardioides TaxID=2615069 RepID=UPI0026651085|nr:hypothetical protein [Nocardioides sp. Arc9.136]WKN48428.1 hypothetical protein OSR43_20675 [Nocardioides sp. Arc9.136]